ncbi:MAG: TonB-dependent receptor [Bacteroidota bacterium]
MKRAAWMLAMSFLALAAYSQHTISGVVVDNENQPLPGASLVIDEIGRGGVASTNGAFSLENVPEGTFTLKITFVGYETKTRSFTIPPDLDLGRISLKQASLMMEEVMVTATRAGEKDPVAFTTIDREEISSRNFGQDVPFLLSTTPSLVTSSDAGHGIGYTTMRIRGTDANRINVTINGIPLNDAESHAVYWVDLPDIATSVDNIQVQRGVGTSTNGAPAFGASVNLMTQKVRKEPYATYEGTFGSFNTVRNVVSAGTGLLKDRFAVDLRLSNLHSDGYIDRAWTDLKSYYGSAGYYDQKTMVKFVTFSGKERLYQAWNGVPSYMLESDRTYNSVGEYTDSSGNTAWYDNQIDNYRQDHYQLHLTHEFSTKLYVNAALHYTKGAGYWEEYKEDQALSGYQMEDVIMGTDSITKTDLIRQRWLDNDFFGVVGGLHYKEDWISAILGGGWNRYDGDHFGTVVWARVPGNTEFNHRWYENRGVKTDWNSYLKTSIRAGDWLSLFTDLQIRGIDYSIEGIDNDLRDITQPHHYLFFNPKAGLNFQVDHQQRAYFSVSRANREPNRSNFVDADPARPVPVHETLLDYEAGYSYRGEQLSFDANLYYMNYRNQLVMTGEINDVGSPVMTNVKESYRTGLEFSAAARFTSWLRWDVNTTLSSNRIRNYVGYVDNWDYWVDPENEPYQVEEAMETTNLSFSPGIIASSQLDAEPVENLHVNLISRYVGRQYIDNTSSQERKLDPYFVNDLRISYALYPQFIEELSLHLQILNLLNVQYETNAWVYRYYSEGEHNVYDGFYPQAGLHFMAGVRLRF